MPDNIPINVQLVLQPEATTKSFESAEELTEFIRRETQFWRERSFHGAGLTGYFKKFVSELEATIKQGPAPEVPMKISHIVESRNNDSTLIYSDTAVGEFLAKLYETKPNRAAGAYALLKLPSLDVNMLPDKEYLLGILLIYASGLTGNDAVPLASAEEELLQKARQKVNDLLDSSSKDLNALRASAITWQESAQELLSKGTKELEEWKTSAETKTESLLSAQQSSI
jgi:hypothetical protein